MSAQPFFVPEAALERLLHGLEPEAAEVEALLAKARALEGLTPAEAAVLCRVEDPERLGAIFTAARQVKERVYGPRLVLFAPLYVSSRCTNDCAYCAFRATNRDLERRTLDPAEIARETEHLVAQGHKRVLLVAGEAPAADALPYVLDAIASIYGVGDGAIRRVNVNVAPLEVDGFRALAKAGIGTYQLFQETYHRPTYDRVHLAGRKRDFEWRLSVMDRAMEGGIEDVGLGALFGLADWRFEVLALLAHARHLESRFGVGPHTISVPRLEPAAGSDPAARAHPVSDGDLFKLTAILRLAVPYTGLILSTRERPEIRREVFGLGVSQISAGSRTDPGGYDAPAGAAGQFQLGDHRSLDEVVRDVARLGFVPSFCTGCYRLGRTGRDFMDRARPGEIKLHCDPNALSTFEEYLADYASQTTRAVGRERIARAFETLAPRPRAVAERLVARVREGRRDVFV